MTSFRDYTVEDTKVAVARALKGLPPYREVREAHDKSREERQT